MVMNATEILHDTLLDYNTLYFRNYNRVDIWLLHI